MSLTREVYINILRQHGRRVANRVALSASPTVGRELLDFYRCYAPEDDLPPGEQSKTDMVYKFDPAGWFVYYQEPSYSLWPEPPKENEHE